MATPPSDLVSVPSGSKPPSDLMSGASAAKPPSDLISTGEVSATKPRPTLGERAKRLASETLGGAAAAAAFPEVMTVGGRIISAIPTAPTKAFGGALMGAGELLGAQRAIAPLSTLGVGAMAGGAGEASAQAAELAKLGESGQEIARLIGGVGFSMAPSATMSMLRKIAIPGFGREVGAIYKEIISSSGLREESMNEIQKKYVQAIAQRISEGTLASDESARVVRSAMRAGAKDLQNTYASQSSALERQADDIVNQANAFAASRTAEAASKIDALNSQFNTKASEMMQTANAVANRIRQQAKVSAERIRSMSLDAGMRPNQAAMQGQGILNASEDEAKRVVSDASSHIQRLRSVADKARQQAGTMTEKGAAALRGVGEPVTRTQRGESLRERVIPFFNRLKETRSANAEKFKGEAFNVAAQKEQQGIYPKSTEEFKSGMKFIDQLIRDSPESMKAALRKIKNDLQPMRVMEDGTVVEGQPINFAGLEKLRRNLRDRSYGAPVEGFDAIGKIESGKIADYVERIQKEFSPGIETFLERYHADSEPLRQFQTRLGKMLVGKEDFDAARFATDPATLSDQIFKSKSGVNLMIEMLGGDTAAAEQIARSHVADELMNADARGVRGYLNNKQTRDWIDTFPALKRDLETAATTMERVSGIAAKRNVLADALRGRAGKEIAAVPGRIEDIAARVVSGAEKTAAERVSEAEATRKAGETAVGKRAEKIRAEAQKEGAEAISEAGRRAAELKAEAGKLSKEGQEIASRIVGKKFDELQVRDLILSGDESLWSEVAPIINRDAKAKESMLNFIKRYMGDAAKTSPRQITDAWKTKIRPAVAKFGIADQRTINDLDTQIEQLSKTVDAPTRANMMQRLMNSVFATEAARPISSLLNLGFQFVPQ